MLPSSSRYSLESAGPSTGGPSPYEIMLESAPSDYLMNLEGAAHKLPSEYPVYYFIYDTLRAPTTLKRISNLPEEGLELRPAQIIGYVLGKWGDNPALVYDEQGQVVSGSAYLVRSEEQAQKLAYYETKAYKVFPCWILFTDDKSPAATSGKTFMYAGDQKALLEKRFDCKLWALNEWETGLRAALWETVERQEIVQLLFFGQSFSIFDVLRYPNMYYVLYSEILIQEKYSLFCRT